MKKILGVIMLVSLTTMGVAQVKDTRASKLLDNLSAKTKACKSIKADFTYTMQNKQAKINESKSGTLLISGDKYRLTAAGQTVISNGKTVWTYLKESNEVQVNNVDPKDETLTPSKLLTSYNTNYKSTIIKDKDNTDPNVDVVELIPNSSKNFIKAHLLVDRVKLQVKGFRLFDKNGNIYTYKVVKYATDVPVTPSDFSFEPSKFPGVEVIDMR